MYQTSMQTKKTDLFRTSYITKNREIFLGLYMINNDLLTWHHDLVSVAAIKPFE